LYNNPGSVATSVNDKNYLEVEPASETVFSTATGIQFFSEHHQWITARPYLIPYRYFYSNEENIKIL
jgi:hypothetical protein